MKFAPILNNQILTVLLTIDWLYSPELKKKLLVGWKDF